MSSMPWNVKPKRIRSVGCGQEASAFMIVVQQRGTCGIQTVAVGDSLKSFPGKLPACGHSIVQLWFDSKGEPRYAEYATVSTDWECQKCIMKPDCGVDRDTCRHFGSSARTACT